MAKERTRRIQCRQCRRFFETRRVFGRFCSVKCRVAAFRERERELKLSREDEFLEFKRTYPEECQ